MEHDLIAAAIDGGVAEADALLRAVWPRAYRIAFSVLRNRMLAEDAAQEACAVLFRSIGKLRCAQAFGVWFYRIVVRQAVALEKRNAHPQPEPLCSGGSDLDASLLRIDVAKALAALSPPQRIAIALHYYAEMNSREIAQVLAIPDSSVRFHIMRAKRALEQTLLPLQRANNNQEEPYGAA